MGRVVLEIQFAPTAMILAQAVIATLIVTGTSLTAFKQLPEKLPADTCPGRNQVQMYIIVMREARLPLPVMIMAAFGAVISKVGASIMVVGTKRDIPGP
jgi:tungstate transport system permease protein